MPDFLPTRESELVTWLGTFRSLIVATPTIYGLSAPQATAYQTLAESFVDAYNLANADATRSPSNIIAKDDVKRELISKTRELAGIIQKFPATTDQMRSDLGLTVPAQRTPIPPPAEAPKIDVVSMTGHTLSIRLHDGESTRRRRPSGVSGASIFTFVGEAPATEVSEWTFVGSTTRTSTDIPFDSSLAPGTKVWVTAFWFNPRAESGPAADPVSAVIQYGGLSQAA